MSFLAHVLVVLAIAGVVVVLGGVAVYFALRRVVRRRWRLVGSHVVTRHVMAGASAVTAWGERRRARASFDEVSRAGAGRVRRALWTSIEDAEAAVAHADARNAPVAELPAVCASLRRVGGELDHLLRLERRLPAGQGGPAAVRAQVAEVINAARDVQSAALRACGDATAPQIHALVRAARDEIEIVGAALSRMRSVASP